ncbi:hypothetical protein [Streptomyces sp. NPDC004285]
MRPRQRPAVAAASYACTLSRAGSKGNLVPRHYGTTPSDRW